MATQIDYYELLEVTREASGEEIKRAFRQKVRTCHPDRCRGDSEAEQKFKQINEAYTVLSNPEKRAHYDRYGTAEPGQSGNFTDLFDLMGDFFGFSGGRASRKGEDHLEEVVISLEEAAKGCTKQVEFTRLADCAECRGTGGAPDSPRIRCDRCGGRGVIIEQVRSMFGIAQQQRECPLCGGVGYRYEKQCLHCKGSGTSEQIERQEVRIPAGVEDGVTFQMEGRGHRGPIGSTAGDLYVRIRVEEHQRYKRQGTELFARQRVELVDAITGGEINVETLIDGVQTVTLEPGTQSGSQIVLKGMGMPHMRLGRRGDLTLLLTVDIPSTYDLGEEKTAQLRALLGSDAELEEEPAKKSWFGGKKKKGKKSKK